MYLSKALWFTVFFLLFGGNSAYQIFQLSKITQNCKTVVKTAAAFSIAAVLWGELCVNESFANVEEGSRLFEQNCSGCHLGGGNVIGYARNKTLKLEALKKGGYNSRTSIVDLLENGAGAMPRYTEYKKKNGDIVPAKLNQKDINEVADYVLLRASQSWK